MFSKKHKIIIEFDDTSASVSLKRSRRIGNPIHGLILLGSDLQNIVMNGILPYLSEEEAQVLKLSLSFLLHTADDVVVQPVQTLNKYYGKSN